MGSQREKTVSPQMNLILRDQPALTLPTEQQKELGLALLELLLNAAGKCPDPSEQPTDSEHQGKGDHDHDESQTHC